MESSSTSLSLLQRARNQEQEAWHRLVVLYGPLIQHWCKRWGIAAADADDIQQEVFRSVAASLAAFRRDRPGDSFRGWLRVITRRKFLDLCRRDRVRPEAEGGTDARLRMLQVPEPAEPEEVDSPDEVKRLHHRALDLVRGQFEPQTWQMFWRCAVEGQAPADIARDLNLTPAAVRKAKSRVLRRLKEEFGELLS